MHKIRVFILLSFLLPGILYAEQAPSPDLLELLSEDIDRYSQIATNTRQNVDYMPYVISVLESDELNKLSVQTLRDALALVPGIDLSIGMAGIKNPVFRGSNPYALGQSKLLIDGVVVNDTLFGAYVQYLDMPVELIQRIEVVRGPGSLMSHVNGYSGSIHVITKANRDDELEVKDEFFAAIGSEDYLKGGFIASYENDGLQLSTDLFYQQHEQMLLAGLDRFGRQGETDQGIENYNLGFNLKYGDWQLKSRLADNRSGVSYGQAFTISDDESDYLDVANNYFEISYRQKLNSRNSIDYVLGYFDESRELQNKVMPDGTMVMMPPPPTPLPDGRYFTVDYQEQTLSGRVELVSKIKKHEFVVGLLASTTKIKSNDAAISDDGLQTFNEFDLLSAPDRDKYTFYIEDLINIDEKFSLQLGLKLDKFSDVDTQLSPRIASVYRHDNENIFKFMYTRSFREPSWREQYLTRPAFFRSTGDLVEEKVEAYEASYIKKSGIEDYFKVNAFYLENKDQIHAQNSTNTFLNNGDNELFGAEFEYKKKIALDDVLYLNYSYVDGKNVFDELASSAQHMSRMYYIHQLSDMFSLSGTVKYVGDKERVVGDVREKVKSYTTLDLAFNYSNESTGIGMTLGVTNALDKKYVMPSPANTYVDDFEQMDIGFYFSVKGRF